MTSPTNLARSVSLRRCADPNAVLQYCSTAYTAIHGFAVPKRVSISDELGSFSVRMVGK